ncbi:MAG: UDP-N-acetylmuramoyl-L-alanine--D-glutamate ligase [Chloroflexi bacterium]|nr:UDP-N-acetylmuramoyl-L-alanine--D-glutamate ligase [Chloroflexota bacterium]
MTPDGRDLHDFRGQRVLLVGLGTRTTVALARELIRRGADVAVNDQKPAEQLQREIALLADLPVRLALGGNRLDALDGVDWLFVSPGVPRELPMIVEAERRGIAVSSEIELLFADCPAPIVGITGSSGKTTTTTLVGEMLRASGRAVFVGGNIGTPLIDQLDRIGPDALVVLELSSFQLEHLTASPHVGAILNLTPNHLDRHGTMERYAAAKLSILRHQRPTDFAILGADDPTCRGLAAGCPGQVRWFSRGRAVKPGAFLDGDRLVLGAGSVEGAVVTICRTDELQLLGEHNVANVLAAAAIAGAAGADIAAMRAVATTFAGVEHRIEPVRTLRGVTYSNDSIATTPERAAAALRAMRRPVVLIAGGRSKHLPLDEVARLIVDRGRAVVTIGEMADEVAEAVRRADPTGRVPVLHAGTLERAVPLAAAVAQPGDVVLLSPAGTSFDAFRDFEERGQRFKELVRQVMSDE